MVMEMGQLLSGHGGMVEPWSAQARVTYVSESFGGLILAALKAT